MFLVSTVKLALNPLLSSLNGVSEFGLCFLDRLKGLGRLSPADGSAPPYYQVTLGLGFRI